MAAQKITVVADDGKEHTFDIPSDATVKRLPSSACYAPGMMVEITDLSFRGKWAKLEKQVSDGMWSLRIAGREPMDFLESEFQPSGFHESLNQRILSKHNV